VPRWTLGCATAADCGDGFSCDEQISCTCPGSPGTGTGTPGSVPPSDGGREPGGAVSFPKRLILIFNNAELNALCEQMHQIYTDILEETVL